MKVYIPLAQSDSRRQYVNGEARDALAAQTVECEIIECLADGEIQSQRNYSPARIAGEATARNLCVQTAIEDGTEFFIMADRDRVAFATDAIEALQDAISADPTLVMVSAVEEHHCDCVDLGFVICRLSAFSQIIPIVNIYRRCLCREVNEALSKIGFRSQYLSQNIFRTKEV
jgi:hypothetical protein